MSSQSIEINGKHYDARTGQLLTGKSAHTVPRKQSKPNVVRSKTAPKRVHGSAQRSNTLMRHSVKRPAKLTQPKLSTSKPVVDIAKPISTAQPEGLMLQHESDPARAARARSIKRSNLVRKFSDFAGQPSGQQPAHKPATKRVEKLATAGAPALSSPVHRSAGTALINKGLKNAQSHTQTAPKGKTAKKSKRGHGRLASIGAGSLAVVLLAGFIFYQNIPNISMRYAAQQAGISARLPNYQPAGFALSRHIKYNPGQIEVSFNSNTDDRSFTITQRESTWNSDTLMSHYVAQVDDRVHTYEDKGRTIYLYGDSNATWVNGGVWYDIKGDSRLNSDQLIRIATSM